jgi:hypothetical protein
MFLATFQFRAVDNITDGARPISDTEVQVPCSNWPWQCWNQPFEVATSTLVASINSETQRCDAPICLRILASHSYAFALSGNTMMTSCMSSNSCTRTPHLKTQPMQVP